MAWRDNTTEAFWHPVMGAVDLITGDVIRKRQQAREEKLLAEENARKAKGLRYEGMLQLGRSALQNPNLEPADQQRILGWMGQVTQQGIDALPTQQPELTPTLHPVPQELVDLYPNHIKPGRMLPQAMIDELLRTGTEERDRKLREAQQDRRQETLDKSLINYRNREVGGSDKEKRITNLIRMREAYAGKMVKGFDEQGNETYTLQQSPEDKIRMRQIDEELASLSGFEPVDVGGGIDPEMDRRFQELQEPPYNMTPDEAMQFLSQEMSGNQAGAQPPAAVQPPSGGMPSVTPEPPVDPRYKGMPQWWVENEQRKKVNEKPKFRKGSGGW